MKALNPATGPRLGVLAATLGIAAVIVVVVAFLKHKSTATAEGEPPPPPTETTAVETAPPAPAYATRPKPHNFAKRRGAPRQPPARPVSAVTNAPPAPSLEAQYGIRVRGVRMALGETWLDLRYKVLDAEKAGRLAKGQTSSYLVDSASGAMLLMPKPPAEGAFPPTGNRLVNGRTYFALIANPDRMVKSGSQVTFHVEGAGPTKLVVQ